MLITIYLRLEEINIVAFWKALTPESVSQSSFFGEDAFEVERPSYHSNTSYLL